MDYGQNHSILISVVTVVFNGGALIEKTIQSITEQTYTNIEYIIIDGGSTDNTLSILERYKNKISFWKSESDKGIYDAMNKGIHYSNGDWIIFMNAGDTFYEKDTLEKVSAFMKKSAYQNADLIFGDVWLKAPDGTEGACELKNTVPFLIRNMICHQCIFYSRRILDSVGVFDISFRFIADFEHLMRTKAAKATIKKIDLLIANYSLDGVSAQKENIKRIWKERMTVFEKRNDLPFFMRVLFWLYARLAYEFRRVF